MFLKYKMPSIVALHYVSDDPRLDDLKPWVITHKAYVTLLDFLQVQDYKTLGFEDVKMGNVPDKSIIITFDDCPKHLLDFAIPELIKRDMKAVFYMPTAYLGGYNQWDADDGHSKVELMDESDIQKIDALGMEVGSHAHNHLMLEEYSREDVALELLKSKTILEAIIKKPVISFAYPYGSTSLNYGSIVKDVGYEFGLSVNEQIESRFAIRRWIYDDSDTIESIRWKLSKRYRFYRAFHDNYDYVKKKVLTGCYRRYAKIKKAVFSRFVLIYSLDSTLDVCAYCEIL